MTPGPTSCGCASLGPRWLNFLLYPTKERQGIKGWDEGRSQPWASFQVACVLELWVPGTTHQGPTYGLWWTLLLLFPLFLQPKRWWLPEDTDLCVISLFPVWFNPYCDPAPNAWKWGFVFPHRCRNSKFYRSWIWDPGKMWLAFSNSDKNLIGNVYYTHWVCVFATLLLLW